MMEKNDNITACESVVKQDWSITDGKEIDIIFLESNLKTFH